MKRSEAIEKMKRCYQTCKVMRYSDEQAMDRVLELLEEMGIQAPPRERTEEEIKNPRFDAINMAKYIREWAAEDEQES